MVSACPTPPRPSLRPLSPLVTGGLFAVLPENVRWCDDASTWACRYATADARIPEEFRVWQAVWIDGAWEVDEI